MRGLAPRLGFDAAATRFAAVFLDGAALTDFAVALGLAPRAVLLARCGARVAARADFFGLAIFVFMGDGRRGHYGIDCMRCATRTAEIGTSDTSG
jgi:hypothetical protein